MVHFLCATMVWNGQSRKGRTWFNRMPSFICFVFFLCCHFSLLTASAKCILRFLSLMWVFFITSAAILNVEYLWSCAVVFCIAIAEEKKYSLSLLSWVCQHSYCSWHLYNLYIIKWFIFNVYTCPCFFYVKVLKEPCLVRQLQIKRS